MFLCKLVVNDVVKLIVLGKVFYIGMFNEEGGVIDDFIIYFFLEMNYCLVVNLVICEKDLVYLVKVLVDFVVMVIECFEFVMIVV